MNFTFDPIKIRALYPSIQENPDIAYLDSASSAAMPQPVLDSINHFYQNGYANPGRGSYPWATSTLARIHSAREHIASSIGGDTGGLIFTSGSTHSLNLVALAWGTANLVDGDEVLINPNEHSSQIMPWYKLQKNLAKKGIKIILKEFRYHPAGDYDVDSIVSLLTPRTKLISLSHVHNVSGMEMELLEIRRQVSSHILLSVDASQSVGHMPVNAKHIGADFLSFSGHKLGSLTGIGALWCSERVRDTLQAPFSGSFSFGGPTGTIVDILENGTPNMAGIISLDAAFSHVESLDLSVIHEYISELTVFAIEELRKVRGLTFLPGPAYSRCAEGWGILSFNIEGIDPADIGFALAEQGIYVRTGIHCLNQVEAPSVRASFYVYTLKEEIVRLADALNLLK